MKILASASAVFALLAGGAPLSVAAGGPAPESSARREIEREAARLREEVALAQGRDFYLKLDARTKRLSLVLRGVPLLEVVVDEFEMGRAQVFFRERTLPTDWDLRTYGGGRLDPPRDRDRLEVVAPAPSPTGDEAAVDPSPPALPPTAEEAYSVPSRYRIVFAGGVSVEVTAKAGGRNRGALRRAADALGLYLRDLGAALRVPGAAPVRIRLRMSAEDAAALYRSLPPDVALLVAGLAAS
jgi:hypothetical protein